MPIRDVIAVVLSGGAGTRLYPLTKLRAKPAVPLGGKYRLIDVPISNCLNSGIHKIYVLTQFLSASLNRHIAQTYKFDIFSNGYVEVLAAEQTPASQDWYQGTADAVRKQLHQFMRHGAEDILILSGDHLYRMDYSLFIERHREARADVTIGVQPVNAASAPRLGILKTDAEGRIVAFREKPPATELDGLESVPGDRPYLASMGIYVFRTGELYDMLARVPGDDFGKQVIPASIEQCQVYAFPFEGYWADIGTIEAFYEANLDLTLPNPPFDFHDPFHPIYSRPRFLPPSRVDGCKLEQVVLSEGCMLQGAAVYESVLGLRSIVRTGARLTFVVTMGADYYETPDELAENRRIGRPNVGIGEGTVIERAIIDKNARIGKNVSIRYHKGDPDSEGEFYVIRDGIVVIPKNAIVPDGAVI